MENNLKRILISVILVFAAVVSFMPVADRMTAPETYGNLASSIDEKAETVLKLTATSTLASAGISAIPGDTATPIAEKLADFTEYFLLILSVLYAEKYLLTVIGAATFKILIPLACVLLIIGLFRNPKIMNRLAAKFLIFAVVLSAMIPLSIGVSDMIYDSYKDSIDDTIAAAEQFTDDTAELSEAGDDKGLIASALRRLSETASGLADRAAELLNRFVESLAVMIVTSCIMPILALVFFVWVIKMLTGLKLPAPAVPHLHEGEKKEKTKAAEE